MYINGLSPDGKLWQSHPFFMNSAYLRQFGKLGLSYPFPGCTVYIAEQYYEVNAWTNGVKAMQKLRGTINVN